MQRALILVGSLVLLCCPTAWAQKVNAPPGNSGVDEYFETVPGSGGNTAPGHGPGGGSRLSPSVRRELARGGAEGRAVLKLAESTSPPASHREGRRIKPAGSSARSGAPGGSPTGDPGSHQRPSGVGQVHAVREALGGSDEGGMGLVLP